MKKKPCLLIILSLLASSILGFTGCDSQSTIVPGTESVKIGIIAPLSGPDKTWGENGILGVRTALSIQPFLENGTRIELVLKDDRNIPELTRKALHQLAEVEKVSAILVFSSSSAVLPLSRIADVYETPILAILSTHPDITGNNKWISQLVFDDNVQGTVAALYVLDELLIDRVAVFKDYGDPHSSYLADEFVRKYKEAGIEAELVHLKGESSDYTHIVKVLSKKGLDFLYLPLNADKVIEIERATRGIGWNPDVMVSDGLLAQIMLQFQDDLALVDGMLAVDLYSQGLQFSEYGKKIARRYNKSFEAPGTTFAALGSEGLSAVLTAMQKCDDSTDRGCINRKLRSDEAFPGLLGEIRIDEVGKAERPIFINSIENKRMKPVVKVY